MAFHGNMLPILFFCLPNILFSIQMRVHSFTVDLIHRDSPQSPLYNPLITNWDRLNGAIIRSASRAAILNKLSSKSPKDIQSRLNPSSGEFLMKLFIGSPPVPQFAIVDSGSDTTWFQVKYCQMCFNQTSPSYDPQHSTTYRNISCNTQSCKDVPDSWCSSDGAAACMYAILYGGNSTTYGHVGTETFSFKPASRHDTLISIPELVFGCGTYNTGIDEELKTDGILGIGCGRGSFINQLSKQNVREFSYCLPSIGSNPNVTGKISFGNDVRVRKPGSVIVPLKKNASSYIITMESIYVNKKIINLSEEKQINETNDGVLIDSGTTFTYLPDPLYARLSSEVKTTIREKAIPAQQPGLCYNLEDKIKFPKITFKFKGGGELELPEKNVFMQVNSNTVCLAIVSSGLDMGIIGNVLQSNFIIGFDLGMDLVSFVPNDCTSI